MKVYMVEELSEDQSLQLFCYHAFRAGKPDEGFADLSKRVVQHSGNLPLALKVLGFFLSDKREAAEWESTLMQLQKCPHDDVIGRLRVSYDGLKENEQRLFLDLACVFNRIDRECATYIWEACGFYANIIIRNLIDKALIKINNKGELEIHDLLQEMGKQIVRQENNWEPWKRSRLWKYNDILPLLNGPKECNEVEGISIDLYEEKKSGEANCLTAKAFANLPRLRLLRMNHANFDDNLQDLPMKLNWLEWKGCPLKSLPQCFDLENIVVLDLSNSKIVSVSNNEVSLTRKPTGLRYGAVRKLYNHDSYQNQGQSRQVFQELKVLILKGCKYLLTIPNFAAAPNLVKLVFDDCYQLIEVDESIRHLKRLAYLSMRRCENLLKVPDSINLLLSLEVFILEGCSQVFTLPEKLEGMKSLKELDLRGTGIERIPVSVVCLTNLEKLLLQNCNSLASLPYSLGYMQSLKILCLSNTAITNIPKSVVDMSNLQKLDVRNCKSLVPLPKMDGSMRNLTKLCLLGDFVTQDYQIDFDVFMNFSEEDTTKSFADCLYNALRNKGMRVFVDQEMSKEEGIQVQCDVIERSEIFIPIFSRDYAKSRRCLMDIARIVDCKRLIIPIFLDIDPLDIIFQRGAFGEAFQDQEEDKELDERTVNQWRAALMEAGRTIGYHFNLQKNWCEVEQIEVVTERVFSVVNKLTLDEPKHTVGIDYRVNDVLKLLSIEINDVCLTGIVGSAGIGKTTLAKAVYNKLHRHFEGGSCFIPNVREACRKVDGLVTLQANLVHNISKSEVPFISSVEHGITVIKEKIRNRRVLIVLDDVGDQIQLDALLGNRDWLGLGSRIIVTTRYLSVLVLCRRSEDQIYWLNPLNKSESLHLLCLHAFMTDRPKEESQNLNEVVLSITCGLPMAIEIVGSYLFRTFGEKKWVDKLQKLGQIAQCDGLKWLRVIYNELDKNEREMFLDVACFFVGKDAENAIYMWKDCGYLPQTEPHEVILHNPLIKINTCTNIFEMHDTVRDMGREIVWNDRSWHGMQKSRLWYIDEICTVLTGMMGTADIQGLVLDTKSFGSASAHWWRGQPEWVHDTRWRTLSTRGFYGMLNLRLLHIDNINLEGNFGDMPRNIKWLQWRRCPMESLPSDFSLEKLVILDLSDSSIKQVWQGNRIFHSLKALNLSGCVNLVQCPEFISIPCLEKLVLDHCDQLAAVDESIGSLRSLVHFSASCCTSLMSLPENVCRLQSLRVLKINGCSGISMLPLQMENMKSLKELDMSFTSIERIPYSLGCLPNLKKVNVTGCKSILTSMSSVD